MITGMPLNHIICNLIEDHVRARSGYPTQALTRLALVDVELDTYVARDTLPCLNRYQL